MLNLVPRGLDRRTTEPHRESPASLSSRKITGLAARMAGIEWF